MSDCNEAFAAGYDDAEQLGENLNPYEPDTNEWQAYEDGFIEYINAQLEEAAELMREEQFGA